MGVGAERQHGAMGEQRWTEQQWDEQQWDEQQWGAEGQVVAGYVARARRIADLSQRELAQRLGVGPATVGRWECGGTMAVDALTRVLALAGLRLQVVDEQGDVVPPFGSDAVRDNAGRRFPAHLDVVPAGAAAAEPGRRAPLRPCGAAGVVRPAVDARRGRSDRNAAAGGPPDGGTAGPAQRRATRQTGAGPRATAGVRLPGHLLRATGLRGGVPRPGRVPLPRRLGGAAARVAP